MDIDLRLDVRVEDAKKMIEWLKDEEVTKFLNDGINSAQSLESVINSGNAFLLTYYLNQDGRFFMVDLNKKSIGFISLFTIVPKEIYEIVIVIGNPINWGKGYGKFAIEHLLRIFFFEWRHKKIVAKIKHKNERSKSLFVHSSFVKIKENDSLITYEMDIQGYENYIKSIIKS